MSEPLKVEPDLEFVRRIKKLGGDSVKKCYQCATCSVVCELSPEDKPFPRKEMIWAQWGLKDRLLANPDVWLCYQCGDCSEKCPRGAQPGDVLGAARTAVIEEYAVPRFMGRALNSPRALPFLLLFAALVVFFHVWLSAPETGGWGLNAPLPSAAEHGGYEGGYFGNFLKHGVVEMVFISGNFLVFLLAAIGLMRFWKDMKKAWGVTEGPSFIACAIEAVKEIATHREFLKCKANKPRSWGHLLVFYGFMGAMATAGLAVTDMIVLGNQPPLPPFSPIKLLGNASFFALFIGSLMLIFRRAGDRKGVVGKGGYSNTLFLVMILLVALTGGLTQVGRLLDARVLAYQFYFVHMTAVFFLLWFAPYSKFGHMFYRTLAIVFARSIGRSRKAV